MIASPSREPRLREGSGDVSEIDRETERGRGERERRTESAIADKSHRAADNAPLSPSSGAATLKAFQPRHHSYIFLSTVSLSRPPSLSFQFRFRQMFRDLFIPLPIHSPFRPFTPSRHSISFPLVSVFRKQLCSQCPFAPPTLFRSYRGSVRMNFFLERIFLIIAVHDCPIASVKISRLSTRKYFVDISSEH